MPRITPKVNTWCIEAPLLLSTTASAWLGVRPLLAPLQLWCMHETGQGISGTYNIFYVLITLRVGQDLLVLPQSPHFHVWAAFGCALAPPPCAGPSVAPVILRSRDLPSGLRIGGSQKSSISGRCEALYLMLVRLFWVFPSFNLTWALQGQPTEYPTALGFGCYSSMGSMLQLLHGRLCELEPSVFEELPVWMAAAFLVPEDLQRLEGLLLGVEIGPPEPLQRVCSASQDFYCCTI